MDLSSPASRSCMRNSLDVLALHGSLREPSNGTANHNTQFQQF